jgi:hypothetical protein
MATLAACAPISVDVLPGRSMDENVIELAHDDT